MKIKMLLLFLIIASSTFCFAQNKQDLKFWSERAKLLKGATLAEVEVSMPVYRPAVVPGLSTPKGSDAYCAAVADVRLTSYSGGICITSYYLAPDIIAVVIYQESPLGKETCEVRVQTKPIPKE